MLMVRLKMRMKVLMIRRMMMVMKRMIMVMQGGRPIERRYNEQCVGELALGWKLTVALGIDSKYYV